MMPRRVARYLFDLAGDETGLVHDCTYLAVSAVWYHIYMAPRGTPIPKDRYMHYAIDNGIVFG